MSAVEAPKMRDSDLIFLMVKRLEQVAVKMTRYEYDQELEDLMSESAEIFEWMAANINRRKDEAAE